MRSISDTIARLTAAGGSYAHGSIDKQPTRLQPLSDFGTNPGQLRAFVHIPAELAPNAPLVVVLHGCTQSAAGYDRASGWSRLADREGFALLYPEQQSSNNPNGCFNWFDADDTRRGSGEALSIRQMIAQVQRTNRIDASRIFVTGLSAGGAMSASMLATYPEMFAGGAIIAGLPHGVASGMVQAFDRMRGHGLPGPRTLGTSLRKASDHNGPWPKVSVWHGSADPTVSIDNAEAIVAQWRDVHGLATAPSMVRHVDGAEHRCWRDADGQVQLEAYVVPGMGHGTPLKLDGPGALGSAAPFMLDAGISSTLRIAEFWGICDARQSARASEGARTSDAAGAGAGLARIEPRRLYGRRIDPAAGPGAHGIGQVIDDALRAAGLKK